MTKARSQRGRVNIPLEWNVWGCEGNPDFTSPCTIAREATAKLQPLRSHPRSSQFIYIYTHPYMYTYTYIVSKNPVGKHSFFVISRRELLWQQQQQQPGTAAIIVIGRRGSGSASLTKAEAQREYITLGLPGPAVVHSLSPPRRLHCAGLRTSEGNNGPLSNLIQRVRATSKSVCRRKRAGSERERRLHRWIPPVSLGRAAQECEQHSRNRSS